jgi:hypothetical protein
LEHDQPHETVIGPFRLRRYCNAAISRISRSSRGLWEEGRGLCFAGDVPEGICIQMEVDEAVLDVRLPLFLPSLPLLLKNLEFDL